VPHYWYSTIGTALLVPHYWYRTIGTALLVPHYWYHTIGNALLVPHCWYHTVSTALWYSTICTALLVPHYWYRAIGTALLACLLRPVLLLYFLKKWLCLLSDDSEIITPKHVAAIYIILYAQIIEQCICCCYMICLLIYMLYLPSSSQAIRHSPVSTALNEWAARCKGRHLHDTQQTQETKYMPSVGLEPAIPTTKRLQPHALDRKATEIGHQQLRPAQ
jgi:hypothetical protein